MGERRDGREEERWVRGRREGEEENETRYSSLNFLNSLSI